MSANDLMGAFADIQSATSDLMLLARRIRTGSVAPDSLKLIEDGLFQIGSGLLELTRDLRLEATMTEKANREAMSLLDRARDMLARWDVTMQPGLEYGADFARAPADSFDTALFEVGITEGVVVVREKVLDASAPGAVYQPDEAAGYLGDMMVPADSTVVSFPSRLGRALIKSSRSDGGGAA